MAPQPKNHYQHVVVSGLPYDRGFSHGSQLKEKIHQNVAYYKLPGKLPPWFVAKYVTAHVSCTDSLTILR